MHRYTNSAVLLLLYLQTAMLQGQALDNGDSCFPDDNTRQKQHLHGNLLATEIADRRVTYTQWRRLSKCVGIDDLSWASC